MSYPTVNFLPTTPTAGLQPIAQTSTTQQHPLGFIVQAQDATYGQGEFIYLVGVASTAKGDAVCYNSKTGATVRAVHAGATSTGAVAVAMSDNVASQYGWYQISGSGPVNTAANSVAADAAMYLTSAAGALDDAVVSGDEITGFTSRAVSSAGFTTCQLERPSIAGGASGGPAITVGTSAAMIAGSKTISTAVVTASSKIFLTHAGADVTHAGVLSVGTIVAATSFVINSSDGADVDTVNWMISN